MSRRVLTALLAVVLTMSAMVVVPSSAGAQSSEVDKARARADAAAQAVSDAETELTIADIVRTTASRAVRARRDMEVKGYEPAAFVAIL